MSRNLQLFRRESERRLFCTILLAFVLLPLLCPVAAAQSTQFWPETDFFLKIKPRVRGDFICARANEPGDNRSAELGPDIEFYFRQFVRNPIKTNNTAERQLQTIRVGYHSLSGVGQPSENRIIVQGTTRAPIFWSIAMSDRNRIDLRWIQTEPFSWRYRNRLMLERSFKIRRVSFSPYIDGEIMWVSTSQSWSQIVGDIGVTFPAKKWLEFTPYYERYNKSGSNGSPATETNAIGFITAFYFHLPGASY